MDAFRSEVVWKTFTICAHRSRESMSQDRLKSFFVIVGREGRPELEPSSSSTSTPLQSAFQRRPSLDSFVRKWDFRIVCIVKCFSSTSIPNDCLKRAQELLQRRMLCWHWSSCPCRPGRIPNVSVTTPGSVPSDFSTEDEKDDGSAPISGRCLRAGDSCTKTSVQNIDTLHAWPWPRRQWEMPDRFPTQTEYSTPWSFVFISLSRLHHKRSPLRNTFRPNTRASRKDTGGLVSSPKRRRRSYTAYLSSVWLIIKHSQKYSKERKIFSPKVEIWNKVVVL